MRIAREEGWRRICLLTRPSQGMSNRSTFEKLSDILIEHLGVEPADITLDSRFFEDLAADSLDLVEIVGDIEREWNLEIDDATAERIRTIGDTIALIEDICS